MRHSEKPLASLFARLKTPVVLGVAAAFIAAMPASAGNIFLTGHDDDFHDTSGSTQGAAQLAGAVAYVRNGSIRPVLTFDAGTELTPELCTKPASRAAAALG